MKGKAKQRKRAERMAVIDNIAAAVRDGDMWRKVELSDPTVTDNDIEKKIVPFDILRQGLFSRIRARVAIFIGEILTRMLNRSTEIEGIEHAEQVLQQGGAVITSNHFNIADNTVQRLVAMRCKRRRRFHIVVQESNIFMKGFFGFLMRNGYTIPVSRNRAYTVRKLMPAMQTLLQSGALVLIYPEREMWFNYKKPRPLNDGAYFFAARAGVPVIPTFVEMRECEGYDGAGFKRVRYILHIMPPIYPDKELSTQENARRMRELDYEAKLACYERVYGIRYDESFIPDRDIAGYVE